MDEEQEATTEEEIIEPAPATPMQIAMTVYKNPFNTDKIQSMEIRMNKRYGSEGFNTTGAIEFRNGLTRGVQEFTGEDFTAVYLQMMAFVESVL
jgi:hypothetical protein